MRCIGVTYKHGECDLEFEQEHFEQYLCPECRERREAKARQGAKELQDHFVWLRDQPGYPCRGQIVMSWFHWGCRAGYREPDDMRRIQDRWAEDLRLAQLAQPFVFDSAKWRRDTLRSERSWCLTLEPPDAV